MMKRWFGLLSRSKRFLFVEPVILQGAFFNWEATLYVWTANTCRLSQGNIVFAFSALVEHLHTDHQLITANRSRRVEYMIWLPWPGPVRLHMWWLRNTNYQRWGGLWMVVGDSWWWALKLIWSNLAPCHCCLSVSVCLCLTLVVWRPLLVQRTEHVQRGWEGWWFNPHPEATTRSKLTTIFPSQQRFNLYLCKHAHLMLMVNWSTNLSAQLGLKTMIWL